MFKPLSRMIPPIAGASGEAAPSAGDPPPATPPSGGDNPVPPPGTVTGAMAPRAYVVARAWDESATYNSASTKSTPVPWQTPDAKGTPDIERTPVNSATIAAGRDGDRGRAATGAGSGGRDAGLWHQGMYDMRRLPTP